MKNRTHKQATKGSDSRSEEVRRRQIVFLALQTLSFAAAITNLTAYAQHDTTNILAEAHLSEDQLEMLQDEIEIISRRGDDVLFEYGAKDVEQIRRTFRENDLQIISWRENALYVIPDQYVTNKKLEEIAKSELFSRAWQVKVDIEQLTNQEQETISLQLPAGDLQVSLNRSKGKNAISQDWVGSDLNEDNFATFYHNSIGELRGTISIENRTYELVPDDDHHILIEYDQDESSEESYESYRPSDINIPPVYDADPRADYGPIDYSCDPSLPTIPITISVAFSPAAQAYLNQSSPISETVDDHVTKMVSTTNQWLRINCTGFHLEKIGDTERIEYTGLPRNDSRGAVDALLAGTNVTAATLREFVLRNRPHIGVYLVGNQDFGSYGYVSKIGIAADLSNEYRFLLVRPDASIRFKTLLHEIAHIFGARHQDAPRHTRARNFGSGEMSAAGAFKFCRRCARSRYFSGLVSADVNEGYDNRRQIIDSLNAIERIGE